MTMNNDEAQGLNLEQLMQLGIQTAKEGNKPNARVIFQQILDIDKQNERALLWMAAVAATPEDRVRYLKTVLRVNPNNKTAQKQLESMKRKKASNNSQVMRYGLFFLVAVLILVALAIVALYAL
jgi:thioredoxin-like negative regulator of GroEL